MEKEKCEGCGKGIHLNRLLLSILIGESMLELLIHGLFALLTFAINSIFLVLYFSTVMSYSSKFTLFKEAFKIALPGTFLISIFIFIDPMLPRIFPSGLLSSPTNIGVIGALILWAVLTRRYCETDWLSTITISFVAAIFHALLMFFIGSFLILVIRSFLV